MIFWLTFWLTWIGVAASGGGLPWGLVMTGLAVVFFAVEAQARRLSSK